MKQQRSDFAKVLLAKNTQQYGDFQKKAKRKENKTVSVTKIIRQLYP